MARLLGNQGLIMNQANGNAYTRIYSCARTTTGGYIRFTISGGNPPVHIFVKSYVAFTQTNGSFDFNTAITIWQSMYCDTSGNMYGSVGSSWNSGAGMDRGWNTSSRQADLWISASSSGGFPGKASINCEIYCDRWDYVTLTQLA
jgi:hypothetical protein